MHEYVNIGKIHQHVNNLFKKKKKKKLTGNIGQVGIFGPAQKLSAN